MRSDTFFPTSRRFDTSIRNGTVAIITRTKNRPLLLARAFASMLEQSYAHWHLYLVNDGGDPAPVEALVALYRSAFNGRISVIHHAASLGMEAASNAGLAASSGDYVVIHDDDDAWHPRFLETTVRFLEASEHAGYAAVASNCEVVHEEIHDQEVIEVRREPWGFWKPQVDLLDQLVHNRFPPICLLIRRSVVDLIGPYNADLPVLGDWDYNLRILLAGDIGAIDLPLAYYHHRTTARDDATYGNSVHNGWNKHLTYQALYRNSMLRTLLRKEPGFAGLAHVVLKSIHETDDHLEQRLRSKLDWIHWDLNNHPALVDLRNQIAITQQQLVVAQNGINRLSWPWDQGSVDANARFSREFVLAITGLSKLMRPFFWVWHGLRPLRSLLAKLRGRV